MDHFASLESLASGSEPHKPDSDGLLVSAAQAGHEWAFAELSSRCSKRILFKLWKITKNWEDAEDVLQESIMKAFLSLTSFNHASSFSTWLTRISINTAFMMLRRRRVRRETFAGDPGDSSPTQPHLEIADRRANPEELYIIHENEARLRMAISQLPAAYRHVIELRQQSDGPLKEIAENTGITIAATKSRMMRARKALRSALL